jgi:ethanolamine utilization cobalamin adenosyltransferase
MTLDNLESLGNIWEIDPFSMTHIFLAGRNDNLLFGNFNILKFITNIPRLNIFCKKLLNHNLEDVKVSEFNCLFSSHISKNHYKFFLFILETLERSSTLATYHCCPVF